MTTLSPTAESYLSALYEIPGVNVRVHYGHPTMVLVQRGTYSAWFPGDGAERALLQALSVMRRDRKTEVES